MDESFKIHRASSNDKSGGSQLNMTAGTENNTFNTQPFISLNESNDSKQTQSRDTYKLSDFQWCRITALTLTSCLSGFCFGYDTAVISGASLYLEDDFPDITP